MARTGRKESGPDSDFRAAPTLTTDRVIRATALQHLVVNTRYNTVRGRDSGLEIRDSWRPKSSRIPTVTNPESRTPNPGSPVAHQTIIVLDFGSQYTQLIARRLRELSVYSEVWPPDASIDRIRERNPAGIILSGGPKSVSDGDAPKCEVALFDVGVPVLGICYGM